MNKLTYIAKLSDTIKVPVIDNGEQMVELDTSIFKIDVRKKDMEPYTGDRVFVRKQLAEKLVKVNELVKEDNPDCKILVTYGYRSPEVQQKYFSERLADVNSKFPEKTDAEKIELAHAMSAHPDSAGHTCGAAIDISIWDSKTETEWDMGSQIAQFDEKAETLFAELTEVQKNNRLYLQSIMMKENFAPFLGEWWHFSYGDKEWAFFYDEPNAIYNTVKSIN